MSARRRRFWAESALAASSTILLLVTIARRDWIEAVLHIDPDGHSGTTEWVVVAVLAVAAVVSATAARGEWPRAATSE
jgi:hypothetical protein